MEKLKPTYLLALIKAAFLTPDCLRAASRTALRDAGLLNLKHPDIIACIQSIEVEHFYKSMTSDQNSRVWQDVYYVPWGDVLLYVKFTQTEDGELFLISFKEKQGGGVV